MISVMNPGMNTELVKYLGVHLNNKLGWIDKKNALYWRGQSRFYLLRLIRSFGVHGAPLRTWLGSVISHLLWCFRVEQLTADRNKPKRLVRKGFLGCPLHPAEVVGDPCYSKSTGELFEWSATSFTMSEGVLLQGFLPDSLTKPAPSRPQTHQNSIYYSPWAISSLCYKCLDYFFFTHCILSIWSCLFLYFIILCCTYFFCINSICHSSAAVSLESSPLWH